MKVKVIGAGSIGNHLSQAARRMGWDVVVVDPSQAALDRMKNDIYPTRYGAWDNGIKLYTPDAAPKGGFELICIGTPPHVRMKLALDALKEKPKVLQLEKPLGAPFDPTMKKFLAAYKKQKHTKVIVGYDHSVARSIIRMGELLKEGLIGSIVTVDVEFREHWEGIFKAHPWLKGPEDTYLGYWRQGGGASGEHSHALHLWQYLARISGLGKWKKVSSALKIEKRGKVEYDSIAAFNFVTDKGYLGRVIQDVVTKPTRKWARIQGTEGFIEWFCGGAPTGDLIRYTAKDGSVKEEVFDKKRPDDFYQEMLHVKDIVEGKVKEESPMSLESGASVIGVLETVWGSKNKPHVSIKKML